MDLKPILDSVLAEYALPWAGTHGVAHWARVLENGLRLAEETGADVAVVSLFAVLHDSRRVNEAYDPGHGQRSALFAAELRGKLFELADTPFELLTTACAGHTDQRTHADVTIRTCWDADRLDLGRVSIRPDPKYLGTEPAKRAETIRWADARAVQRVVPDWVSTDWGVQLTWE